MVAERGGYDLMPEQGTRPVNKYLQPRPKVDAMPAGEGCGKHDAHAPATPGGLLGWLDRALAALD